MSPLSMLFHFAVGSMIGYAMARIFRNRVASFCWTVAGCLLYALTFGRLLP